MNQQEAALRDVVRLTPEEEERDDEIEQLPGARDELLNEIARARDPAVKRTLLAQLDQTPGNSDTQPGSLDPASIPAQAGDGQRNTRLVDLSGFQQIAGPTGDSAPAPSAPRSRGLVSLDGMTPVDYVSARANAAPTNAPPQGSDFVRGFSNDIAQVKPLLMGAVALVGNTGEEFFGSGGISTAIKNWGLKGYQEGMQSVQANSKDTDSLSVALGKLKQGDLGAMADWTANALGFAAGELTQAGTAMVAGGLIGSAVGPEGTVAGAAAGAAEPEAIKSLASSLLASRLKKITAELVAQQTAKDVAPEVALAAAEKAAPAVLAKQIGSTASLASLNLAKAAGMTYGTADEVAEKDGRELDGGDLARVWVSSVLQSAVGTAAEEFGLGKLVSGGSGTSRLANAMTMGGGGAALAAGEQVAMAGLQRYGAGQDLTGDDAYSNYLDAAGLGAAGGAAGLARGIAGKPLTESQIAANAETAKFSSNIETTLGDTSLTPEQRVAAINDHVTAYRAALDALKAPSDSQNSPAAPITSVNTDPIMPALDSAKSVDEAIAIVNAYMNQPIEVDLGKTPADMTKEQQIVSAYDTPELRQFMDSLAPDARQALNDRITLAQNDRVSGNLRSQLIDSVHGTLDGGGVFKALEERRRQEALRGTPDEQATIATAQTLFNTPEWIAQREAQTDKMRAVMNAVEQTVANPDLHDETKAQAAQFAIDYANERIGEPNAEAGAQAAEGSAAPATPQEVLRKTELAPEHGAISLADPATFGNGGTGANGKAAISTTHARLLQVLGRALGRDVQFFQQDGATKHLDGFVNPDHPDTIFLNQASSGAASFHAVMGHEFFHSMPPEIKSAFINAIRPELSDENFAKLQKYINQPELDKAGHLEEIASDLFGNRFTESDTLGRVFDRIDNPTVAQRLVQYVRAFIDKITQTLGKALPGFKTDEFVGDLNKVRDAFVSAMRDYLARESAGDGLIGGRKASELTMEQLAKLARSEGTVGEKARAEIARRSSYANADASDRLAAAADKTPEPKSIELPEKQEPKPIEGAVSDLLNAQLAARKKRAAGELLGEKEKALADMALTEKKPDAKIEVPEREKGEGMNTSALKDELSRSVGKNSLTTENADASARLEKAVGRERQPEAPQEITLDTKFSNDREPIEFNGDELGPRDQPTFQLVQRAREYARRNFAGKTVNIASDGSSVEIPWRGIKHAFSGKVSRVAALAGAKLDEILAKAEPAGTVRDKLGRDVFTAIHYYETPISIDGKEAVIRSVVRETADGRRYYDHFEAGEPAKDGMSGNQPGTDQLRPTSKAGAISGKDNVQDGGDLSNASEETQPKPKLSAARTLGDLTPDQAEAVERVLGKPKTIKEQFDEFRANWKKNLVQGIFDQFAPLKELSQKAYLLARMSKGGDSTLEALMLYGKVFVDKDGFYDINFKDGDAPAGFARALANMKGEHDRLFLWVAAQRAEQLKAIGLENLFSDKDIAALKTLNQGVTKDGTPRAPLYEEGLRALTEFNNSVLKIAADSGLIDEATRTMYSDMPYVPFYRLQEEGAPGFNVKAGIVNQAAWKRLTGGTDKLNSDLMANTLQNWSHLITASAKNRAAKAALEAAAKAGVAMEVPSGTPGKGLVSFKENGHDRTFMVSDPHVMDAITGLESASLGKWSKPFIAMKRVMTTAVTANPAFKIRNLIRDSIQSIAIADLDSNALNNIRRGWIATEEGSATRAKMLAGGGMIRFGSMLDGNSAARVRELVRHGVDPDSILDSDSKIMRFWKDKVHPALEAYHELGDRGEQINRAALYERLIEKGMSHGEANFWARDLLDFSGSGKWTAVRTLTQVVPFMNARLQGLYKLGTAGKEDIRRLGAVTAAVAFSSLGLMMAYKDDQDWKKREDWDRQNYWWFKVGGLAFRIPKPFELGAIGTIAEMGAEYFATKDMTGKRFLSNLGDIVGNQLNLNPIPQLVKPALDVYANVDSFTNRPIENMAMQRLQASDRYGPQTSQVARFLGGLGLPDPVMMMAGHYTELSPVKVDELVKGYFGWLGTMMTTALDYGIRPMLNQGATPSMQLRDVFLAGNFVETLPSNTSRYMTQMYDQARDIEQAYASYHQALKSGDYAKAQGLMSGNPQQIAGYQHIEMIKREESRIHQMVQQVQNSATLSADTKRKMLDSLSAQRDQLAHFAFSY